MISILLSLAGQHLKFYSVATSNIPIFLPPANEVWGKVIFLNLFVILFIGGVLGPGGTCLGGVPALGGVCSSGGGGVWSRGLEGGVPAPGGVSGPGGIPAPGGGGGCLLPGEGGAWWRPPRDGYCCGRYASYWNAFLLSEIFSRKRNSFI